jgi:hypothetical protein
VLRWDMKTTNFITTIIFQIHRFILTGDCVRTPENEAVNTTYYFYHAVLDRRWICRCKRKVGKGKGKVHPCTGTEALYRPYGL